ncbi:hypothetical protein HDV05_008389, partial [Chytridiales sp. JEL 0842]
MKFAHTILLLLAALFTVFTPFTTAAPGLDFEEIIALTKNVVNSPTCNKQAFGQCVTEVALNVAKTCNLKVTTDLLDNDLWIRPTLECVCPKLDAFQIICTTLRNNTMIFSQKLLLLTAALTSTFITRAFAFDDDNDIDYDDDNNLFIGKHGADKLPKNDPACNKPAFAQCSKQFGIDIGKACKVEFTKDLFDKDRWVKKAADCVCPQMQRFQTQCLPLCPAANNEGTNLGFNKIQKKCVAIYQGGVGGGVGGHGGVIIGGGGGVGGGVGGHGGVIIGGGGGVGGGVGGQGGVIISGGG